VFSPTDIFNGINSLLLPRTVILMAIGKNVNVDKLKYTTVYTGNVRV